MLIVIRSSFLALCLAAACTCAQAASVIINVGGMQQVFTPAAITIHVNDTVTFINKGGFHNAVADDGSFRCARGCDGKGGNGNASSSNWIASVTFTQGGTFGYFCETHGDATSGMRGSIAVQAATPVTLQSFGVD